VTAAILGQPRPFDGVGKARHATKNAVTGRTNMNTRRNISPP